jgi:hypothetical protein
MPKAEKRLHGVPQILATACLIATIRDLGVVMHLELK